MPHAVADQEVPALGARLDAVRLLHLVKAIEKKCESTPRNGMFELLQT